MHLSDALLSAPVAIGSDFIAASLLVAASSKIKKLEDSISIPLMGVMGAFVFAAQMVNFSIPGTGSSGHIIGGVLLAALLGAWPAFLTIASVIIIQCLIFADGGLMALGCNIINMGAMSTLVAYPLVYKPIAGDNIFTSRIMTASVVSSVTALELGAVLVTVETALSGITEIPIGKFLVVMTGIHFIIGTVEGLATGAVLLYIKKTKPEMISSSGRLSSRNNLKKVLIVFIVATVIIAGGLAFLASSDPDGLEWSIEKVAGAIPFEVAPSELASGAKSIQDSTAVMPDYDNNFSGIAGVLMVVTFIWVVSSLIVSILKRKTNKTTGN